MASRVRRDLHLIFVEVGPWATMVAWGESYLVPFALALGVSEAGSGLVLTVPLLLGALLQLGTPRAVAASGSLRTWTVTAAAVQGLCFLPLAAGAWAGWLPLPLLVPMLVLYWACGLSCGPAWMTWVDTIIPERLRARFFARRSRWSNVLIGAGLLASGWVLQSFTDGGLRLTGFAALFLVAGVARLVSARLLARQSEAGVGPGALHPVSARGLLERESGRATGYFLAFLLVGIGVFHMANPFLAALVLEQYRLSYLQWVGIVAAPFLARIAVLSWMGTLAERHGAPRILWLGGVMLVPVALGYVSTTWYPALLLLALYSGVALAAQNLGAFLLLFETIRTEERTAVMTAFNLAGTAAMAAGSFLGSRMLAWLGEGALAYRVTFGASSLLQLAALVLLWRFHQLYRPAPRRRRGRTRASDGALVVDPAPAAGPA